MLAIEGANDVHLKKAYCSMLVIDLGISILVNDVKSWKATTWILVTDVGMSTPVNELHG